MFNIRIENRLFNSYYVPTNKSDILSERSTSMKRLAIVGSSGGNLYNQGGNDPYGMMKEIFTQAGAAGVEVGYIQFIGTTGSMDTISEDAKAKLYFLRNGEVAESEEMSLKEINKLSEKYDEELAGLIREGKIDLIVLGADRITANGDVANKIGTSGVAILARHYGIPFYVLGPTSTIDLSCPDGDAIAIEERDPGEVTEMWYSARMAPKEVKVYNPAFDVTPHELISAIITEKGLFYENNE